MITAQDVKEKLSMFLDKEVNKIASTNTMIAFFKPIIDRIINGNIDKLDNMLALLANEDGHIDVPNILNEMISSLMNTKPFTLDTGLFGDAVIGDGLIKIEVPFTSKQITLNSDDVMKFRQMFL